MSVEKKDSEVDWIGRIPAEWVLRRLKYTSSLAGRIGWQGLTSEEYQESGPYLITGTDFKNGEVSWETCVHISNERWAEAEQVQIENGDLLITKDGTVGKVAICSGLKGRASLNSGVMVIRPKTKYSNRYLFWLLQSQVFWGWFNNIHAGSSTITHLYQGDLYNFQFYLPPSSGDQARIASAIDFEVEKLDSAARVLNRQISLLADTKRSLIHESVTRGLDPNVSMKDSGIDWIGDIPATWECKRLKYVCQLKTGQTPPSDDLTYFDGDVTWYTPGDIQGREVENSDRSLTAKAIRDNKAPQLPRGVVLLVAIGATVGKSAISFRECSCNQQVTGLIAKVNIDPKWLFYAMQAQKEFTVSQALFTTLPILNNSFLGSLKIPIPPISSQVAIAGFLDKKCDQIDVALAKKRDQLELLRLQRQSLIFEYVTGKRRARKE